MILYHGTTAKAAKQILKDGVIKSNISRNYDNELAKTTDGLAREFY